MQGSTPTDTLDDTRAAVDGALLKAVDQRSVEALHELVDRHGAAVYSAARLLVGSDSAASGVAEEVFVRVWRAGGRLDWTGDLRLGLVVMTWRHCRAAAASDSEAPLRTAPTPR